jgi:hypothetical protein
MSPSEAATRNGSHLKRIGNELGIPLSPAPHCDRVSVWLGDGHEVDIVVVAFIASKAPIGVLLPGTVSEAMPSA